MLHVEKQIKSFRSAPILSRVISNPTYYFYCQFLFIYSLAVCFCSLMIMKYVFVCDYCYLLSFKYFAECHFKACLRSCVFVVLCCQEKLTEMF